MARVQGAQTNFPGWIQNSFLRGAAYRAQDLDWQGFISSTDSQGQADALAWLTEHLGDNVTAVSSLTLQGEDLEIAYTNQAGSQTAAVNLSFLFQGVANVSGHSEGWAETRINTASYGVSNPAIWVWQDADGNLEIGDTQGYVNGVLALSTGGGSGWNRGAANAQATFWAKRSTNSHVNHTTRAGTSTGAHTHEIDGQEIGGMACSDDTMWLVRLGGVSQEIRLLAYGIDADGNQDPVPNSALPSTDITSHMPTGFVANADLRGLVHYDGHVYVLVYTQDTDGVPITRALAFAEDSPFTRNADLDREFGVHTSVTDGWFLENTDFISHSHWITRYTVTSVLDHTDTPRIFGAAGLPFVVNTDQDGLLFSRLADSALGDPFTPLASNLAVPHDALTEITGLDFSTYAYLAVHVHDSYNRNANTWLVPYAQLNGLSVSADTTLQDAANNARRTTAWLGAHEIEIGLVRRAANGLAIGALAEVQEPMRTDLIGSYTSPHDATNFVSTAITLPSAPDGGLYGISFGDEMAAIQWFLAEDLLTRTRIPNSTTSPTDANSILLSSVLGTRDVRLARENYTLSHDALAFWVSHTGHSPYPLRLYRTWTSTLTNLTIHADVYGLGRRT